MMTFAVKVQYDGSRYSGFQRQIKGATIQGELERAISELTGVHSAVTGSGRTDAGVHAIGQVISFKSESSIPSDRWALALNTKLPQDIRAVSSCVAPDGFSARFDAQSKQYRYLILPKSSCNAIMGKYAWVSEASPSIDCMRRGAAILLGERDFSSFRSAGSVDTSPVRNLSRLDVQEVSIPHLLESGILVYAEADGFLYKMVRNIVGALFETSLPSGGGPSELDSILQAKDRTIAPSPAPPGGLYLAEVRYPASLAITL